MCFFEICFYNDNSVPENNDESHRKRGYRILDRLQKNLSFLFMILTLNYVLTYRYRYKSKILVTYRLNLDQNQIKLWSIRIRPIKDIIFEIKFCLNFLCLQVYSACSFGFGNNVFLCPRSPVLSCVDLWTFWKRTGQSEYLSGILDQSRQRTDCKKVGQGNHCYIPLFSTQIWFFCCYPCKNWLINI